MSAPGSEAAAQGAFADWAHVYRQRGYWPRPITPGSKACHVRDWQTPDPELSEATLVSWLTSHANCGIGPLMGSPFPDGTTLGAPDIDDDDYMRLGRASLNDASSGRIGKKAAIFFVRVRGRLSNPAFMVRGEGGKRLGKVAECLFVKKLCVIPPTTILIRCREPSQDTECSGAPKTASPTSSASRASGTSASTSSRRRSWRATTTGCPKTLLTTTTAWPKDDSEQMRERRTSVPARDRRDRQDHGPGACGGARPAGRRRDRM